VPQGREQEGVVGSEGSIDQVVLIADGDPGFRRSMLRALAATGLRVRQAASGRQALTAVEDEEIALVVLEVRLDDVSGYEVCRQLREEHGDELPILFVSGDRTESFDRVAGLLVGALEKTRRFYEALGFREVWRGSRSGTGTLTGRPPR